MSALGRPRKAGRGSLEPWKGTSQTTSSQVPVSVIVFVEGGFSGSLTLNRNKIMKAGSKERTRPKSGLK